MGGTIICGVTESPEGRSAAELAHALGARLGLRVVLVHVFDGTPADIESILESLAGETEKRVVRGDPAQRLAQIAAEEGADLIVLGSRAAGLGSRRLHCGLARELEAETSVPVLVAPPATRRRSDRRLFVATSATTR